MDKQNKNWEEENLERIRRDRLRIYFAILFQEFENVISKSQELEVLGTEKIARAFETAFMVVYPKIIKQELQKFADAIRLEEINLIMDEHCPMCGEKKWNCLDDCKRRYYNKIAKEINNKIKKYLENYN